MIDESPNINSADKILEAATKLFATQSLKVTYIGKPFIIFSLYLFVLEFMRWYKCIIITGIKHGDIPI